jgi:hypothetical protein
MNRQQGATVFLSEKMCGNSKSDFEFPHIADVKQKLSVFEQRDQGSSGPRFSKQLLFCKNTYHLRFSAQNSYQSVGACRQRPPQINQKNAPDRG